MLLSRAPSSETSPDYEPFERCCTCTQLMTADLLLLLGCLGMQIGLILMLLAATHSVCGMDCIVAAWRVWHHWQDFVTHSEMA